MKKALITGITGFAGSYLADFLLKNKDYEIWGTYLNEESIKNVSEIKDKLNLLKADLLDKEKISEIISKAKPDFIFHLAAMASAKDSFDKPSKVFFNNVNSQLNLLEAVRNQSLTETKILIISSAEVYGLVSAKNLPIDENAPFNPTNPYAVSKLAQDFLGLQYFLAHKLKIIRVRPFNHIGPKQSPNFVVATFAKKIAEIEKNPSGKAIKVGNLNSKRDFTDVKDMVKAYSLAIDLGVPGEVYNLGSGISYSISDILEKLIKISGKDIKIEIDKSLFRPIDNPETVSNSKKFGDLTGWKPETPIEKTLKDTLDYWRGEV